jgi:permease
MNYTLPIFLALVTFMFIAFVLSIPYMIYQYFKYGSIEIIKTLIFFSFIFYLISAYYLVILPLPNQATFEKIKGPYIQLELFNFVKDFLKYTVLKVNDIKTYLPALKQNVVLQPLFNIFLTVPLGIYIRFYKKDKRLFNIVIISFLMSLFYELTQLSGLYFIYPHPYRLFDVDDLLLNTFGGVFGYLIAPFILQFIPSIEELKEKAIKKSKHVSLLRRLLAFVMDYIFVYFIYIIVSIIFKIKFNSYIFIVMLTIYFIIVPLVFKNSTLAMKIVHLKITSDNKLTILKMIKRVVMMSFVLFIIPRISEIFYVVENTNHFVYGFFFFANFFYMFIFFIYYIYIIIKKDLIFYEKFSDTYVISTLKN